MPSLSIIIPTHKRPQILRECLRRLENQTIAKDLEVIVVSDGPDPETAKIFDVTTPKLLTTHYLEIPKSQQGVARNHGVDRVTAPLCLFIGDDIFLEPDSCKKHLEMHQSAVAESRGSPLPGVLGFTTWDPSLKINSVMRWLEATGWQFGYPQIEQYAHQVLPKEIQHRYSYTSHISLPTEVAKKIRFREDVNLYGWEDIEWGMRLRDAGVQLFYEPAAKAFHHHPMTLEDSLKRMETLGQSAVRMQQLDPTFDRIPRGWKKYFYEILAIAPTMRGKHARAFLRGIARVS